MLITKEAIGEKLQMRPEKDQKEIGYIHIGRIQLIVKALLTEGINSSIKLAIMDNHFATK